MRGIIFAILGGACITLQGVVNAEISREIGTWQAATVSQFTGFIIAMMIYLFVRDGNLAGFRKVKPLYLFGGMTAAIIIFTEVTAIKMIGITLSISVLLLAQLSLTVLIDNKGWFDVEKKKMNATQFLGLGIMVVGMFILKF